MIVDLDKKDLCNLLRGTSPSIGECMDLEKADYMRFSGNQHNEDWKWTSKIEELHESYLWAMYQQLKR